MTSLIQECIIRELENRDGEIQGTEDLALQLGTQKNKLIQCARQLGNQIVILQSNGGRGHKTVYLCSDVKCIRCLRQCARKRNRNQPGLPRRKAQ